MNTTKHFTGNKFNLTEIFLFLKSKIRSEMKVIPKITLEDEKEVEEPRLDEEDDQNQNEDEVIDLSHRFENSSLTNHNDDEVIDLSQRFDKSSSTNQSDNLIIDDL